MRWSSASKYLVTRVAETRQNQHFRFPAPLEPEMEWRLDLPPFLGYEDGWSGSVDAFLTQVRDGTIPLQCVPLLAVVDQYTARINSPDLDHAGELIHIAASLIHYKSKLLLPSDPAMEGTGEDLRSQILHEIAAGQHEQRESKKSQTRSPEQNNVPAAPANLSLLDLFVLLNEVEQLLLANNSYLVSHPPITVADQLQWLWERFARLDTPIETVDALLELHDSDQAKICLFLALLEMVKLGQICLAQDVAFGEVSIHPVTEQSSNRSSDQ
jgi:segregation and condensation protein A